LYGCLYIVIFSNSVISLTHYTMTAVLQPISCRWAPSRRPLFRCYLVLSVTELYMPTSRMRLPCRCSLRRARHGVPSLSIEPNKQPNRAIVQGSIRSINMISAVKVALLTSAYQHHFTIATRSLTHRERTIFGSGLFALDPTLPLNVNLVHMTGHVVGRVICSCYRIRLHLYVVYQ
jgi:hypothetical protein